MVPLARYRYTARLKYLAYRAPRGPPPAPLGGGGDGARRHTA